MPENGGLSTNFYSYYTVPPTHLGDLLPSYGSFLNYSLHVPGAGGSVNTFPYDRRTSVGPDVILRVRIIKFFITIVLYFI